MKAKDFKEVINNIPDDAEVLCEYSGYIFGQTFWMKGKAPAVFKKSELKNYEEDFSEDISEYCDYLICF